MVAVIFAVPFFTPVTVPSAETLAIFSSEEEKITFLFDYPKDEDIIKNVTYYSTTPVTDENGNVTLPHGYVLEHMVLIARFGKEGA